MTAPPLVEATGLHTFYGASHVLQGVDFRIAAGETVALMGRNGMGKTTLLRSLLGLTRPTRGTVRINGAAMAGAAPHLVARQGIAFVPEGRGIFHNLTVREHLVLAARKADGRGGWDIARVLAMFPRLGERLAHLGTELSGGEQQMLTIGRALMTNPALLILDEATEGLAPLIARDIWATLKLVRADGIAAIIVDKNFAALSAIADRLVVLVKGEVAMAGATAELMRAPEILKQHLGV